MEIDGSQMAENQNLKRAPFVKRLQGFPTLLRMKNGEPVDEFKGQRTSMEMKNFFEKGMSKKRAKTRRKKGLRKTMKRKKM
jgi:thioredoxin-like negative regulator of GroEL